MAENKDTNSVLRIILSEAFRNTGKDVRGFRDFWISLLAASLVGLLFNFACSNLSDDAEISAKLVVGLITFFFGLFVFRVSESTSKNKSPWWGFGFGVGLSTAFLLILFGARFYYEKNNCVVETDPGEEETTVEPPPQDSPPPPTSTEPGAGLIGDCNISAPVFPCWFEIDADTDSPQLVAERWYDNFDKSDIIAALHREEEGPIDRFDQGDNILVPPIDSTISLEFYLDFLPVISNRRGFGDWIVVCDEEFNNKPCIYTILVDLTMASILAMTYPDEPASRIERDFVAANELSVLPDPGGPFPVKLTIPDPFPKGAILILPSLP